MALSNHDAGAPNHGLTRRQFVRSAGAAGLLLALPACASNIRRRGTAATQYEDIAAVPAVSKRIALCSDTHWGGSERGGKSRDDIAAWIRSTAHLDPDHVFHLGDIVDDGANADFQAAAKAFSELTATTKIDRVWAIAGGNHDGLYGVGARRWNLGYHRVLGNTSLASR